MAWDVWGTDEFDAWFWSLTDEERERVDAVVGALEQAGPALRRPYVGKIDGSRHANMKELVVQDAGQPYRILFAFDPRRAAILLIGGNKTGDPGWYDRMIPVADDLYDKYLDALRREGVI